MGKVTTNHHNKPSLESVAGLNKRRENSFTSPQLSASMDVRHAELFSIDASLCSNSKGLFFYIYFKLFN